MRHCIEATNGRERRIKSRRALKREPINHLSLAYISSIDKMAARAETIFYVKKLPGVSCFLTNESKMASHVVVVRPLRSSCCNVFLQSLRWSSLVYIYTTQKKARTIISSLLSMKSTADKLPVLIISPLSRPDPKSATHRPYCQFESFASLSIGELKDTSNLT